MIHLMMNFSINFLVYESELSKCFRKFLSDIEITSSVKDFPKPMNFLSCSFSFNFKVLEPIFQCNFIGLFTYVEGLHVKKNRCTKLSMINLQRLMLKYRLKTAVLNILTFIFGTQSHLLILII